MTGEELRDRLRVVLAAAAKERGIVQCPMCHGVGEVERAVRSITQTDVAKVLGVSRTTVTGFLAGKQGLTMEGTLRLIEWLPSAEPPETAGDGR